MKISIILPSRIRPAGLLGVVKAYESLSTGNHEVHYSLILDEDDPITVEQAKFWGDAMMFPENTHLCIGPRDKTVNARFNDAVNALPADLYMQACDDGFPISMHWDALAHGAQVLPAYSWQEANDPANATYPVITERWRAAVGRFYPEYFPFWFADTWIAEVFTLAFAKPFPVINQLQIGGKRGKTQGMRDLKFWFDFFAATRIERIAEAEAVAKAYNFTINVRRDRAEQLKVMEDGDKFQLGRVELYEKSLANPGIPSAEYVKAKALPQSWYGKAAANG